MKLEIKKEYRPILNMFVYVIYQNDRYVTSESTIEEANETFENLKKAPSEPEIIRSEEI